MTFRVGQCVECVTVDGADHRFGLTVGLRYTISAVGFGYDCPVCDVLEIKTDLPNAWRQGCFRAIVANKTDIGVFHEILRKVSRKGKVSA